MLGEMRPNASAELGAWRSHTGVHGGGKVPQSVRQGKLCLASAKLDGKARSMGHRRIEGRMLLQGIKGLWYATRNALS